MRNRRGVLPKDATKITLSTDTLCFLSRYNATIPEKDSAREYHTTSGEPFCYNSSVFFKLRRVLGVFDDAGPNIRRKRACEASEERPRAIEARHQNEGWQVIFHLDLAGLYPTNFDRTNAPMP